MNDGWRNKRHKLLLLVRTHRLCSNTARRKQTKNDGSSRKRHKLLLLVRTHRLCSNTARRKQTKNDGSSRKRHKLLEENRLKMMDTLVLVRTHRHYAVILLEMTDGAERKRHWQWQLLLFIRQIRGTWRDRWPTCRETQRIHRAERKRHWPVLLVRSERLVETDDRLADAQGRKKETLTIIVGEIRQTGRNRWETHRYIGQKERDTDHYCWWDYRDWKRQMTDLQRDSQNT